MNIHFAVSYTLREYLSIVGDYIVKLSQEDALKKHPDREPPTSFPLTMLFFRVFGSLAFVFKKSRMPVCEFNIDGDKISRTTKHGEISIPWDEIINLHASADGFILFKEKGGLPIPYRCLSKQERDWIQSHYDKLQG